MPMNSPGECTALSDLAEREGFELAVRLSDYARADLRPPPRMSSHVATPWRSFMVRAGYVHRP
jgi:hypothetical protein